MGYLHVLVADAIISACIASRITHHARFAVNCYLLTNFTADFGHHRA